MEQQINIEGVSVPAFFYGTAWKEATTQSCVLDAIKAGFRAIDTANQRKHYYEEGVGAALMQAYQEGLLNRSDLFLQTKFTYISGQDERLPYDPSADFQTQVQQSFRSSLKHLHTNYLDSYILHGPSVRRGLSQADWDVWSAMEEQQRSGKVKLLGVSNVMLDQLKALCDNSVVKPHFVQNRCFANRGWDKDVRDFCGANGIRYQGFSLLTANNQITKHPRFREIISRYSCSPAQLIFCFALQAKMIPLTGTKDPAHMQEDLKAFEMTLDVEDMKVIEAIGI